MSYRYQRPTPASADHSLANPQTALLYVQSGGSFAIVRHFFQPLCHLHLRISSARRSCRYVLCSSRAITVEQDPPAPLGVSYSTAHARVHRDYSLCAAIPRSLYVQLSSEKQSVESSGHCPCATPASPRCSHTILRWSCLLRARVRVSCTHLKLSCHSAFLAI